MSTTLGLSAGGWSTTSCGGAWGTWGNRAPIHPNLISRACRAMLAAIVAHGQRRTGRGIPLRSSGRRKLSSM
jgi:hypothetical protein